MYLPENHTRPLVSWKDGIPPLLMGLALIVSAFIYVSALSAPYDLLNDWRITRATVGNFIGRNSLDEWRYVLAFAAEFVSYGLVLILARRYQRREMWVLVIIGLVACNLILLFQYPFDAVDIFEYIFRGRMQVIYHLNPFYVIPNALPGDTYFPYIVWKHTTSAYGPLWEMLAAAIVFLSGSAVVTNVLAFKLVAVAGYAFAALLIGLTLRQHAPGQQLFGVVLFAFNPLVLSSTAGSGHNDALLAAPLVLGFYLMAKGRYTLAALAETAGALLKFIPVLVFPIIIIAGFRAQTTWRERLKFLGITGLACSALTVLICAPYYKGGDFFSAEHRESLFTTSLPTILRFYLKPYLLDANDHTIATAALVATGLWAMWHYVRTVRDSRPQAPIRAAVSILLFYLLVTCLWFQPWYVVWVMTLIPLALNVDLTVGALLLSAAAHAQLPLFYLVLNRIKPRLPPPLGDLIEAGATLGLCWLYFGGVGIRNLVIAVRRHPILSRRTAD